MELQPLNRDFSVCKITSANGIDLTKAFTFLSVTDDEISLVCDTAHIPQNTVSVEAGWKGLKIKGVLDFGMVGVIAKIAGILAEQNISIFVISTFNTDFILIKATHYQTAVHLLGQNGYTISAS